MKKIILAVMLSILMITSIFAVSVEIGDGVEATTNSNSMPFTGYYSNSWSHFILPGDAITNAVDITELEFNVSNSPSDYTRDNQIVYMRLTTETTVTTDFTANPGDNGYTEVYNGSVTWDGSGWQGIDLTTPFSYDGTSNLEIIWENRHGQGQSGHPLFYKTDATGAGVYNRAHSAFPTGAGTQANFYPNTRITWPEEGEPIAPVLVSPAQNAFDVAIDADLIWTTADNTDYSVLYLADNEGFTGATIVNPATSPYSTSLNNGTTYFWKVVAVGPTGIETASVVRSFITEFAPITEFPYTEGFEGDWVGSPAAPAGWTQISVSGSNVWQRSSTDSNSGTYSAEGPNVYGGGEHLLVTPVFDFDASTDYRLRFWLKGTSSNTGNFWTNLKIQIADGSYTEESDFTDELAYYVQGANMPTTWVQQTISLENYSGSHAIAFRLIDSYGYNIYVDDVTIEEVPTTPIVQINTDPIDFGTVDLNALPPTETVSIKNIGGGILSITDVTITGTDDDQFSFADIDDYTLAAEEELLVEVTFNPTTAGVKTATLQITDDFTREVYEIALTGIGLNTDINVNNIPYTQGFETEEGFLGWTSNLTSTSTYATADRYSSTSSAHTGTYSYRVFNSGDAAATAELISPVVVPDMDAYRIRFWAKKNNTNNTQPLIVGKYNQAMDSFTPYSSLALTASYAEYKVNMDTPLRANERIAFQFSFSGTSQYFYIDDIVFEEIPEGALVLITPDGHDFGELFIGYEATQTFTVANYGIEATTIIGIDVPAGYTREASVEIPLILEPNSSFVVTVTFSPVNEMVYSGNLRVKQPMPGNPFATINTDVALTGTGIPVPQGATCADPIPLTFPAVAVTGNTGDYINDYSSSWISPSSNYLNGDDVVYQFTLDNTRILNGSITTSQSWMGAFILQEEPNAANPAPVILSKTSSGSTLNYTNEMLNAGTYFLIISSYPSPQSIDYTINLTADLLPAPVAATSPSPADGAIDQPTALTLGWTNAAYTETIDLWFGEAGGRSMELLLDNVTKVNQHEVTDLDPNTTYNWKVVNRNYTGETADTLVATWSFTTIGNAPEAVTYTAPADEAIDRPIVGNLSWGAATGAEGYRVYFSTDNTFAGVVPVEQPGRTYAYSGLEYSTTYYWKVLPYNVVGEPTEGIAVWSFTTLVNPFPEADIVFDGVRSTGHNMPLTGNYAYAMTQNIYYQEEIDIENSAITSISYLYNENTAWSETIEVFMGHTDKDVFDNTSDWITEGFTHVFSGTMSVTTTEPIVPIILDTPFVYNNSDNLVVLFFATQPGYNNYADHFYNYPVVGNRSITYRNDSTNPYTQWPNPTITASFLKAYLPVTGFNYQELTEEPQFSVNVESLTFADQIMGMASDPQALAISNLGLADLGIISTVLTGVNADQFVLIDENEYPITLATGENISVSVVYAPTTGGEHEAVLEITDNQTRVVHTVQLVGNSIDTDIYEINIPYTQGFEDPTTLLGWYFNLTSTSTSAKAEFYKSTSSAHTGEYSARFYNPSSATTEADLISPVVVPNMDAYRVRFWAKKSNSSNTDPLVIGKYDAVMETFTSIGSLALTTTYAEYTVDMVVPERANERFAFRYASSGVYNNIYIDDIVFEAIPTTAVAELNITEHDFATVILNTTSAAKTVTITNVGVGILNINEIALTGANATDFAFEVDAEASMALATGESLDIDVTFTPTAEGVREAILVITDDLNNRVRVSNNSRNANNVTLSGNGFDPIITSLPFFEGFEDYNVHDDEPIGWAQVSETGTQAWVVNKTYTTYNRTPRSGEYNATLRYSNTDWLIRPIELVGGQSYDIELYARQNTTTAANATIGIYYGTEATVASMEEITGQIGVINGDYQLIAGTFIPATSGIYYVGIKASLTSSPWYISIDDIAISESQPAQLDTPVNVTMTSTESGLIITWDPVEGANSYIIYATDRRDGDYEIIDTVSETSYTPDGVDRVKLFKIKASPESINSITGFSRRGRN